MLLSFELFFFPSSLTVKSVATTTRGKTKAAHVSLYPKKVTGKTTSAFETVVINKCKIIK